MTSFLFVWYAWLVVVGLLFVSSDLLFAAIPYFERLQAQHTTVSLPIALFAILSLLYFGIRVTEGGIKSLYRKIGQLWNREYKGDRGDRMLLLYWGVKGILCSFGMALIFIGPVAIPLTVYLVVMNVSTWILQIQ